MVNVATCRCFRRPPVLWAISTTGRIVVGSHERLFGEIYVVIRIGNFLNDQAKGFVGFYRTVRRKVDGDGYRFHAVREGIGLIELGLVVRLYSQANPSVWVVVTCTTWLPLADGRVIVKLADPLSSATRFLLDAIDHALRLLTAS